MAPRRDTPQPSSGDAPTAFDRQGALITHQLQELSNGVKTLSTLLQDMRVENATRDAKYGAHDTEFGRVFAAIDALETKIDSAIKDVKTTLAPLTAAHEQGKPVANIGKEALRWAVAFATVALGHYIWKGH